MVMKGNRQFASLVLSTFAMRLVFENYTVGVRVSYSCLFFTRVLSFQKKTILLSPSPSLAPLTSAVSTYARCTASWCVLARLVPAAVTLNGCAPTDHSQSSSTRPRGMLKLTWLGSTPPTCSVTAATAALTGSRRFRRTESVRFVHRSHSLGRPLTREVIDVDTAAVR